MYAGWTPIISFVVGLIFGAVIMFLVFRNNLNLEKMAKDRFEDAFKAAQAELEKIKEKMGVK